MCYFNVLLKGNPKIKKETDKNKWKQNNKFPRMLIKNENKTCLGEGVNQNYKILLIKNKEENVKLKCRNM